MLRWKRFGKVIRIFAAPSRPTSSLSRSHHSFGSSVSDTLRVKNPGDLEKQLKKSSGFVFSGSERFRHPQELRIPGDLGKAVKKKNAVVALGGWGSIFFD